MGSDPAPQTPHPQNMTPDATPTQPGPSRTPNTTPTKHGVCTPNTTPNIHTQQVVIPAWVGYELFLWATSAGDAVGSLVSGSKDPFAGL